MPATEHHAPDHAAPAAQQSCRAHAAAEQLLSKLQRQHLIAAAVLLLAIPAGVLWQWLPMSQRNCQLLQQSFNSSAVLAGLQEQQQAAAAAGSPAQQLHILTIVGSNTPRARIDGSPLLNSLPPPMRSRVKVLRAATRIGHGLEGFGAFGAKIIELYKYVSNSTIPPTDLVLLTDAFDVIMDARVIASIPKKFAAVTHSSDSDGNTLAVLFAAERGCWPDYSRCSCFPRLQQSPYRYLNAGGLVGHVGYLRALLQPFMSRVSSWTDDQRFYNTAYLGLREQHGFFIDSGCKVFQTLAKVNVARGELLFDADRGSWYNAHTHSFPVLLHGNGNTKRVFFGQILPKVVGGWHWLNRSAAGSSRTGW